MKLNRFIVPVLATVITFGSIVHAATPPQTVPSGGTGWGQFVLGTIPIGGGSSLPGSLRFATSTGFTFATSTQTLTATYASTTAVSGTNVCIGSDCRTSWPSGVTSIQQTYGSAQTGALTFGTSTATSFNGLSISNAITNSGTTFTFAPPTITGTLTVVGGGTGVGTFTSSQLLYGNGTNALSSVATTSATCSGNTTCDPFTVIGASPITISSTGGGSGLSTTTPIANSNVLTYSTAGAGAAYGTATTTFALTSFPANLTGTVGALVGGANSAYTYWGLATTTNLVAGNLLYGSGASGVANVATSSFAVSGIPANYSGAFGAFVGGTGGTWTWWGLSTTTAIAANQILYGTSASGVGSESVFTYDPAANLFTTTLASTTQFSAASQTFYIDSTGKVQAKDTTNNWSGTLTPTRYFALQTGTTTTWTASTTGSAYSPFVVMPFAGTLRNVRCKMDSSFLGVAVRINGTAVTPSYFVASSTVGTVTFSANNTFTAGQRIVADFGTTTTATATSTSCTFSATET